MTGASRSKEETGEAAKHEQRSARRRITRHPGLLLNPDGSILCPCMMNDVSAEGAKLELQSQGQIPDEFTLLLSKYGNVSRKCKVLWRSKNSVGIRFITA
jgi:hypothetical protein